MHHSLSVLFIYDEFKNFHSKTSLKSSHQNTEANSYRLMDKKCSHVLFHQVLLSLSGAYSFCSKLKESFIKYYE